MKKHATQAALFSFFVSGSVLAGTTVDVEIPHNWAKVLTLSIGPAWSNTNETQTFFLQSDIEKTYAGSTKYQSLGMAELFLGWQKIFNDTFSGHAGVAFGATTHTKMTGDVWEDADPDFNNFYYTYQVNQVRVAIKGKLLADLSTSFFPYVSGSIGLGSNRARNFVLTSKIDEEVPAPGFSAHRQTTVTYTIGIGLQKYLNDNLQAGVGYEFADLGKSQLGMAPGQTLNSGIQLDHLYTKSIQFSLTYVA